MIEVLFYSLLSVLAVSLVSFIGLFSLGLKLEKMKSILIYFISFSAGALFGDAFIHLLPEAIEKQGFTLSISLSILLGIMIFFFLEKIICWKHCHMPITKHHVHHFAYMNLIGDAVHNFLDGLIIAASFLLNVQAGIATTIAVLLHEIPQEIGDFGLLVHAGFSRKKALLTNFGSALVAFLGVFFAFILSGYSGILESILVPIAAGGFIYIAGSDLIPELHKETLPAKSALQIISFLLGIGIMLLLLLIAG